ncbi:arabinofuranosyltransferase [Nocardia farcinica]|uniref:arabinofuranosyltransferase n=1 Tax=Nocardia farcinica TaxID=37329 RepID=UPI00189351A7|nr:arabinofuranosyltransferase [Nocardia farcinica]MBF6419378.1 arabinofuranosyltransferase [Nocardia farcinica]MBF6430855.1 arabinofuranosyltransferase [Nocardia farcinica]MBF6501369.1 arabinofuranosyltransferase [Nocardia farcinica]
MTTSDRGRLRPLVRQVGGGVGEAIAAALVAVAVAAVGLVAFSLVEWPAFNSSHVTRALTTVGQVVAAALLVAAIVLVRRRRAPRLAALLSWAGIAAFVTVTLGMPLAATKLYLFGVSVDQEFRTEYLTRLTDSPALRDMTYADIPPFYPAGWFWVGGRVADVLGMSGWEAFKPYAIGSLAVAAVLALVLWTRLIRTDWAIAVTAASTAVALAFASPEAYSAVIVLLLPPALVLAWGALHRPVADGLVADDSAVAEPPATTAERPPVPEQAGSSVPASAGGWGAAVGTGLFLGLAATFYTLYLGVAAFAVTLMGLLAAFLAVRAAKQTRRPRRGTAVVATGPVWRAAVPPLVRLLVIAVIAALIAAVVWTPVLVEMLRSTTPRSGTALHYLPRAGAELPLPMLEFSLLGALCLIGTIWLVVRASSSRRAQALGVGVLAIYLWTLLSMLVTAAGTTLLSFRLEAPLLALLATAGAFGFVEGARAAYQAFNEPERFRVAVAVVAVLGALAFAQDIPHVLAPEITTAYTDTDGDGERADKRPPGAASYYREIDAALREQTGRPRDETVVLTADTTFLAFYPYFGFQALTSHYANPLADFAGRATLIRQWSELDTPAALRAALAESPWRAPDAFLFRRSGETYTLRLAEDVYPNDPNVRRYTVSFPAALFDDPAFTSTDIGPFTLVTVRD